MSAPNGPPNWGGIKPSFVSCAAGFEQSGIDYPCESSGLIDLKKTGSPMVSASSAAAFNFANTTSNWALNCDSPGSCGSVTFKDKTYSLINLHFHSPSEHAINGVQYPLEAHMVHRDEDGSLLVIGTFFSDGSQEDCLTHMELDSGQANRELQSILVNIISGEKSFVVDVASFVGGFEYLHYDGSLTTPPCSEGVMWFNARQRQNVAAGQIPLYESTTGSGDFANARPMQPLNGRSLTAYSGFQ